MVMMGEPINTQEHRLRLALAMSCRQKAQSLRESYGFLTHDDKDIRGVAERAFKLDLREFLATFIRYNELSHILSDEVTVEIVELLEDLDSPFHYDTDKWKLLYENNFNKLNTSLK